MDEKLTQQFFPSLARPAQFLNLWVIQDSIFAREPRSGQNKQSNKPRFARLKRSRTGLTPIIIALSFHFLLTDSSIAFIRTRKIKWRSADIISKRCNCSFYHEIFSLTKHNQKDKSSHFVLNTGTCHPSTEPLQPLSPFYRTSAATET